MYRYKTIVLLILSSVILGLGKPKYTLISIPYNSHFVCYGSKDTGFYSFTATMHYFLGKKALADSLNLFALNTGLNNKISNAPTKQEFRNLLNQNNQEIENDFKLVNARICNEGTKNFSKTWHSTVYYLGKNAISYGVKNYFKTGAQNDYFFHTIRMFNCRTGKQLSIHDLVKDSTQFAQFVQQQYALQQQQQFNVPVQSSGYFSDGTFWLSPNFYCTKDSFIMHYNLYQIGPFERGETQMKLTKLQMKPFLKIQW